MCVLWGEMKSGVWSNRSAPQLEIAGAKSDFSLALIERLRAALTLLFHANKIGSIVHAARTLVLCNLGIRAKRPGSVGPGRGCTDRHMNAHAKYRIKVAIPAAGDCSGNSRVKRPSWEQ